MTPPAKQGPPYGYALVFFSLMCVYAVLAYQLFYSGALKYDFAMIALMLLMTAAGTFCLHKIFTHRWAQREKREIKNEKEEK